MMDGLTNWRARIFAVTWLSYAGFYLCRKNFSVIMPLLTRDLGYSNESLANVIFVYSAAYASGQFAMGLLSDRFGARRVVSIGMFTSAACTAAMGVWMSPAAFLLLQGINGFAQASGWSGLVKIMAAWFDRSNRGVVMAWWCSNYVVGAFLATIFATYAATGPWIAALGWKRGVWAPALALTLLAIVFSALVRERPAGPEPATSLSGLREVLANPVIHILSVAYFLLKMTRYSFLFWLPMYMVEQLKYGADEAGYTSSLYELAGLGGVLLAGYLSDRWMQSRRFPVGALMMAGLAAACLAHPALSAAGRWGNIAGLALIGAMTYGPDTLLGGAATQDASRPGTAATAAGYVNSIGSLGQLVSPFIVAKVVSAAGWNALFHLFVVFAAAGALLLATKWNYRAIAVCQEAS
jgi:OPA family sugar phosphate sensor protein UhpC-like MFS transporter